MQATWHLAISSLAARWGRALLLVGSVAMATALVVAAASVLGTISTTVEQVAKQLAGPAHVRLEHRYGFSFDQTWHETAKTWPGVRAALPIIETSARILYDNAEGQRRSRPVQVVGIAPEIQQEVFPTQVIEGRAVEADGEIVIDPRFHRDGVSVGDTLKLESGWTALTKGKPSFVVVGVLERAELAVLQRPKVVVTLADGQQLGGSAEQLRFVDMVLDDAIQPQAFAESQGIDLPADLNLRVLTAGNDDVRRMVRGGRLGILLLMVLVYLSSAFIMLTSLTTAVAEQRRELAILRCVGAPRTVIASAQLLTGVLICGLGALIGTPLGLLLAYGFYDEHRDAMVGGFSADPQSLITAVGLAMAAGILGAIYPAILAASQSPIAGLSARAAKPSWPAILTCTGLGIAGAMLQPAFLLMGFAAADQFWLFVYFGMPALIVGFFLLAVPVLIALAHAVAPWIALVAGVPRELLRQSLLATPVRHGMTAGTLMLSIGLLVGLWTGGRSIMSGWVEKLTMPDAFVHNYYSMPAEHVEQIRRLPGVKLAVASSAFTIPVTGIELGLKDLTPQSALYVSTEAGKFFDMTELVWVQGDEETARRRMKEGRSLLISREYMIAHGVQVGSKIVLSTIEGPVPFEVVGVISSTGLDIAVQFFSIHEPYRHAAISAVFGSREDAKRYFGIDATNLVLMKFDSDDDQTEARVLKSAKQIVRTGVIGSSRRIKKVMRYASERLMAVASSIAVVTLVIACVGVTNLIAASIAWRRYEFGVLRAMGSSRALLARLILAESLVIGIAGSLVGTGFGWALSLIARELRARIGGLSYELQLPLDIVAIGWGVVIAATLIAATLPLLRLMWTSPRALLSAGRGA